MFIYMCWACGHWYYVAIIDSSLKLFAGRVLPLLQFWNKVKLAVSISILFGTIPAPLINIIGVTLPCW